jgi:hypothetical protein
MSMSISEIHLTRLVTAQGIDSNDHYIRHGNYIPTMAHNLLSGFQSHELEAALQISTWSKRDGSLGASEVAVTRMVFIMNLAILPDLQTQMLLVIECLTQHYSLGTQSFRYSALGWKKIKSLTTLSIMWIVMILGIHSNGRLCRVARQRSFTTRIRRSISGTCSLELARLTTGPPGIDSIKGLRGANLPSACTTVM